MDAKTVLQLAASGLSVILGFMIAVPMGVSRAAFHGLCPLYASVSTNGTFWTVVPGCSNACVYILVAGGLDIVIALAVGLSLLDVFILKSEGASAPSHPWLIKIKIAISLLLTVLLFVCGCIVSVGFRSLCKSYTDIVKSAL